MHIINSFKNFNHIRLSLTKMIAVSLLFCSVSHTGICQNGLMAEYFDGKDFDRFVSAAYVDDIDNTWNEIPLVDGIDPHNCSIRWTGKLKPNKSETYLFSALVDDGIRVWIDDKLIIDQWELNDVGVFNGKIALLANTDYNLKVEYFNALLEGQIKLLWDIEKPKKEQSWYESIFGVEYDYTVIKSDYFFIPNTSLIIVEEEKETFDLSQKSKNVRTTPINVIKEETKIPGKTTHKILKNTNVKRAKKSSTKTEKEDNTTLDSITPRVKEILTTEIAEKYIPKNVQFERAKTDILSTSLGELNTFADFLLDNSKVEVTIEGHTETVGDHFENQKLSERRAIKVARYFVEKGIDSNRIKTIGYGGARPLKIPMKGEYCPQNRRVVFILTRLK